MISMKSMVITMEIEHHNGLTPPPGVPAVREKYLISAVIAPHGLVLLTYLQKHAQKAFLPTCDP